ncbi:hypothetical protein ACVWXO_007559 [Bradyrhizobium sp. LM2.7]
MIEQDCEGISYGAALDDELAVHVGFAKPKFGIDEDLALRIRGGEADFHRLSGTVADGELPTARAGHCHRSAADELRQAFKQQTVHGLLPLERTRKMRLIRPSDLTPRRPVGSYAFASKSTHCAFSRHCVVFKADIRKWVITSLRDEPASIRGSIR